MTIKARMIILVATLLAVLTVVVIWSSSQMSDMADGTKYLQEKEIKNMEESRRLSFYAMAGAYAMARYINSADEKYFNEYNEAGQKLEDINNYFRNALQDPEDKELFNRALQTESELLQLRGKMFEHMKRGEQAEAIALIRSDEYDLVFNQYLDLIEDFRNKQSDDLDNSVTKQHETAQKTTMNLIIISVISAVVILLLAIWIIRSTITTINRTVTYIEAVSNNDLTQEASFSLKDEIGKMSNQLVQAVQTVRETLLKANTSANIVSHGAQEIAIGNQDLSQRTEEQASSLEEVSATIEEMTSSLTGSAANATEANNISKQTLEVVNQGEDVVDELRTAMKHITDGSREIAEIISTVNDIAFQTNLLALNAAVEAARAGEQGRGFAVVAAEVRNLAGRSAEAAKEIEKLIKTSIERVDNGNALMVKTGDVLSEIVENTQKTTDIVGEITSSIREQATAARDIQRAIQDLNEVTQENAALVEEVASSSENMSYEAEAMSAVISQFKLTNKQQETMKKRENRTKPQTAAAAKPQTAAKPLSAKEKEVQRQTAATKEQEKQSANTNTEDFDFDESEFERF